MSIAKKLWLVVGIGVLLILLWQLGFADLWENLRQANLCYLALAVGLACFSQGCRIARWRVACARLRVQLGLANVALLHFSSSLAGLIVPFRAGEIVPAVLSEHSQGQLASIVVANRLLESSMTLTIFLFLFGRYFRHRLAVSFRLPSWAVPVSLAVLGFAVAIIFWIALGPGLPPWLVRRMTRQLATFARSLVSLSIKTLPAMLLLTGLAWSVDMLARWAIFKAVHMSLPLLAVAATMSLQAISGFISPTPGGIGLGQLPPAYFLQALGYRSGIGAFFVLGSFLSYLVVFAGYTLSLRTAGGGGLARSSQGE